MEEIAAREGNRNRGSTTNPISMDEQNEIKKGGKFGVKGLQGKGKNGYRR